MNGVMMVDGNEIECEFCIRISTCIKNITSIYKKRPIYEPFGSRITGNVTEIEVTDFTKKLFYGFDDTYREVPFDISAEIEHYKISCRDCHLTSVDLVHDPVRNVFFGNLKFMTNDPENCTIVWS